MTQVATLFDDDTTQRGSTPLMRQYFAIKDQHPNAILLFRMGDFYETFADDAHTLSQVLGITLTKRSNGKAADVALAGFPHHALDTYLPKLIRAGLRVAVCEQLENPKTAKTIVKRGVTEIVTPGVSFRDELLDPQRSNYVASICEDAASKRSGVAFLEASTGDFFVVEGDASEMDRILETTAPTEILLADPGESVRASWRRRGVVVTEVEPWSQGFDFAFETLTTHFGTKSLKGFGVDEMPLGIAAAGAVLHYVTETQKGRVPHVQSIKRFRSDAFMLLDRQTRRNLDLEASGDGVSVIGLLDRTKCPMGARMFRQWLLHPLLSPDEINERLDGVESLVSDPSLLQTLSGELKLIGDIERLTAKNQTGRSQPRDLVALGNSLESVPSLNELLSTAPKALRSLVSLDVDLEEARSLIKRALESDPAPVGSLEATIRKGYDEELDRVRRLAREGKTVIAGIQQKESARTGISSLKVGYNKVFGYYLEVTNSHRNKVPEDYIRKQTLVNAERYVTPELKEIEEQILDAQERVGVIETRLFDELRREVANHSDALMRVAREIGTLDALCSLAAVSTENGYVRPVVDDSQALEIVDGRHPVVEASLPAGEPFIPNSVRMDPADQQILVITGPNMAGKSVVLRQSGIIVLLAQVGCFVPASSARVGVVDRIFTRVGASDNLAAGESTFLVEMNETANILNNATAKSLILLDEVGRGTSTFDGLSIAWSIVEYLHEQPEVAAKTLFATHYHELNELASRLPRVRNFRVLVQEYGGRVVFLRKLVAGGADHSFGIEVARMAGLPDSVVDRAREVLDFLERAPLVVGASPEHDADSDQVTVLIPDATKKRVNQREGMAPVRHYLDQLDLNRLTPIEALVKLNELREIVDDK